MNELLDRQPQQDARGPFADPFLKPSETECLLSGYGIDNIIYVSGYRRVSVQSIIDSLIGPTQKEAQPDESESSDSTKSDSGFDIAI